jgi:hypothetical protein
MIALPRVTPDHGLLGAFGQVWATTRAEITMQWRRWGLWVAFACAAGLLLLLTIQAATYLLHLPLNSMYVQQHYTPEDLANLMVYDTGIYGSIFFGFVVALLVVDRVGRDRGLGMCELQHAAPQGYAPYVLGKFLGNYVAVLVPTLLVYLLCALISLVLGWPLILLLKLMHAFVLVFVPSSLAAVGLTLLLASFLPLRVVQVGFSLFWLYFNTGLGQYGFGASIFNPSGLYVYPVFFPLTKPMLTVYPNFQTSMQLALLNIVVLLLTAIVALLLTYGSLVFQRHREEET